VRGAAYPSHLHQQLHGDARRVKSEWALLR
jgi:hypothetical protein